MYFNSAFHQLSLSFSGPLDSLPFDTRAPTTFGLLLIFETVYCELFMMITIALLAFLVSISTYFRPCVNDLATILSDVGAHGNGQRIRMKEKLVQFIELHLHFYG